MVFYELRRKVIGEKFFWILSKMKQLHQVSAIPPLAMFRQNRQAPSRSAVTIGMTLAE